MSNSEYLLQRLKRFYVLQEERVETYSLFEEGFAAYLKGAPNYNFQIYKALVNEITTTFTNISKDILNILQTFEDEGRADISTIMSAIQTLEQDKLKNVAELQMKQQEQIDHSDRDLSEVIAKHKERLQTLKDEINEQMENLKYSTEDLYNHTS